MSIINHRIYQFIISIKNIILTIPKLNYFIKRNLRFVVLQTFLWVNKKKLLNYLLIWGFYFTLLDKIKPSILSIIKKTIKYTLKYV